MFDVFPSLMLFDFDSTLLPYLVIIYPPSLDNTLPLFALPLFSLSVQLKIRDGLTAGRC